MVHAIPLDICLSIHDDEIEHLEPDDIDKSGEDQPPLLIEGDGDEGEQECEL